MCSALLLSCASAFHAQTSLDEFRRSVGRATGANAADVASAVDDGKPLVRLLPNNDKKTIAVWGMIRLDLASPVPMSAFRDGVSQVGNGTVAAGGLLGRPLDAAAFDAITLEKSDLGDLRKCEVGDCDVKLPADAIRRFGAEVDWSASGAPASANRVFREILMAYVDDYSRRGNAALMRYDSRKVPVDLGDEHRALLGGLDLLKVFAPELGNYLADYPRRPLPGAADDFYWSKIKFGFKPTITVTHTAAYEKNIAGLPQYFIAARQIYATHYIDSSLTLSSLVTIPADAGGTRAYMIFANLTRSDSLGGMLSGVKRELVEDQAVKRTLEMLPQAKARIENPASPASAARAYDDGAPDSDIDESTFAGLYRLAALALAGLLIFGIYRRYKE